MSDRPADTRRDVGELLRAADPYAGERLTETELRTIRARVLDAGRSRTRFRVRHLATAAVAVLALLAAWAVGRGRPAGPDPSVAPHAATPEASAADVAVPAAPPIVPSLTIRRAPDLPSPAPVVAATITADMARAPRSIHFTAPRGTRIVWTLDPEFTLEGPRR